MCGGETVREDGRSRRREGEEEEEEDEKGDGREEERQASVLVRTDVVITGTSGSHGALMQMQMRPQTD